MLLIRELKGSPLTPTLRGVRGGITYDAGKAIGQDGSASGYFASWENTGNDFGNTGYTASCEGYGYGRIAEFFSLVGQLLAAMAAVALAIIAATKKIFLILLCFLGVKNKDILMSSWTLHTNKKSRFTDSQVNNWGTISPRREAAFDEHTA